MKFFTDELYKLSQSDFFPPKLWEERVEQYRAHIDRIRVEMPPSMRTVADLSFHDCKIQSVLMLPKAKIEIELRGTKTNWRTRRSVRGSHKLVFKEADWLLLDSSLVGSDWLYEEIDTASRGKHKLSVLTSGARHSLSMTFKSLKITTATPA